nr:protein ALP1-like [Nicotiana tomentosiformis]
MDRNAFHILATLAKDVGGLTDSTNMSSSEKLAMFLTILAHHEKNRSIKVDYIRLGWSVSQAFNECLRVILKLTPLLLVKPNPVLEDETNDRWRWFKGCLGAFDGTYIPIRVSSIHKPRYRTRKGDIATNVLAVCDKNLNFIYVLPGWEGSAIDGRVLRDAVVRRNGLKVPRGGYTNGNGFLSPYRGYRYLLKDWQGDNPPPRCREELFNMKHARARNVIDRAFGILKGRWRILLHEMNVDPLDGQMENHREHQHENENIITVEPSDEWTTWRDELAQSMWNERSRN